MYKIELNSTIKNSFALMKNLHYFQNKTSPTKYILIQVSFYLQKSN